MKMDSPKTKEIINICREHEKQYGKIICIDYITNNEISEIRIYETIINIFGLLYCLTSIYSNIIFNDGAIVIR